MSRAPQHATWWAVFLVVSCLAAPAHAQTPAVRVGVRLLNPVTTDVGVLRNATVLADRLFADAGIELIWAGQRLKAPAPELQLTVSLTAFPFVTAAPGSLFGSAVVPAVGCGRVAYVRWDRVESFARIEGVPASVVLGAVLAHEIGHLLLGSNAHAAGGLMRGKWRGNDFYSVLSGTSGFSREQSERMRDQVTREPLLSARGRP